MPEIINPSAGLSAKWLEIYDSNKTPNPEQIVRDTLKTLLINTAGNKPLTQADVSLLHFWLDQAVIEHRRSV